MIRIDFDIDMPQSCDYCPLLDEEFHYCHGRLCSTAWECDDYKTKRPEWCPLHSQCDDCFFYNFSGECSMVHCKYNIGDRNET